MSLAVTLLGTGSPLPDPNRAGPSTLISAGDEHYLVDAGRGVLMRMAAAGVGAPNLSAVLLTHLHSDHITDLNDVIAQLPFQRIKDTLGYHSSPAEAAQTAQRAGVGTLILTHYVPPFPPGGGAEWHDMAAAHFDGVIEVGDDLHRVEIPTETDSGD
ncbi:MBL fold metallo-hydrolase [Candidatus Poriferisodalis sp.]|uniref:MBL fold metallo-hydrolase n=1 Tax=Candidatus Poriferisodalis sp. TaxID=3101277 RepID=UPI003D09AF3B